MATFVPKSPIAAMLAALRERKPEPRGDHGHQAGGERVAEHADDRGVAPGAGVEVLAVGLDHVDRIGDAEDSSMVGTIELTIVIDWPISAMTASVTGVATATPASAMAVARKLPRNKRNANATPSTVRPTLSSMLRSTMSA